MHWLFFLPPFQPDVVGKLRMKPCKPAYWSNEFNFQLSSEINVKCGLITFGDSGWRSSGCVTASLNTK